MLIALEIHLDTGATREFRHAASVLRIGRDPQSDLTFSDRDAKMVSWNHAEITLQDGLVQLADLGSSNGTFLNGVRVTGKTVLQAGDQISLGQLGPKITVVNLRAQSPTPAGTSQPRQGPLGYLDDNEQPVVQPQQDPLPERPIQEPTPSPAAQEEGEVRPAPIQRARKPWKTMAAVVALLLLISAVGIAIGELLPLLNKTTATEQPTLPEAPAPFRGREIRIRFLSATIQPPQTWLERYHQGPETPDPYVVSFHKGKLVFVTQPEGVQVDTYQPRWNVVMPEFFFYNVRERDEFTILIMDSDTDAVRKVAEDAPGLPGASFTLAATNRAEVSTRARVAASVTIRPGKPGAFGGWRRKERVCGRSGGCSGERNDPPGQAGGILGMRRGGGALAPFHLIFHLIFPFPLFSLPRT